MQLPQMSPPSTKSVTAARASTPRRSPRSAASNASVRSAASVVGDTIDRSASSTGKGLGGASSAAVLLADSAKANHDCADADMDEDKQVDVWDFAAMQAGCFPKKLHNGVATSAMKSDSFLNRV